jgi:transposase
MLIFFLKKLGYTYRRIRKSLKYKQNAEEYIAKLAELNSLIELEQKQHLTIYYGDESGFSETPYIPYGWQKKGDPILLPSKHGKRMNVFGLMSSSNELHAYTQEKGSIKSDFVIQSINDFVMTKSTKGRSVIVLDNARIHSKAFNAKIIEWEKENVLIFFLPTYSPHLNLIETFWRKCKYEWLLPKHYKSWEILTGQLRHIFKTFGAEYTINFRSNLNVA